MFGVPVADPLDLVSLWPVEALVLGVEPHLKKYKRS
jgi:hypothetical protein